MLAWPALACLKRAHPGNRISVLVPGYTAPLARVCPWVDEVILDPGPSADRTAQRRLIGSLGSGRFDALLTLFSTGRIGWLGWQAGIPLRVAPATKWAQIFYNRRVVQRRSRSLKPEYSYNLDLAHALLERLGQASPSGLGPPYWPLPEGTPDRERDRLATELGLDRQRTWIFLHAGDGGSAANLAPPQYAELAAAVSAAGSAVWRRPLWLLTAGPGEEAGARTLRDDLVARGLGAVMLPPRQDLAAFALALTAADLFIAGSTGPLHIAGCLDLPTAGFYPAKRTASPLRWQTCNREANRLAFTPAPTPGHETDMSRVDLRAAANAISGLLARRAAEQRAS